MLQTKQNRPKSLFACEEDDVAIQATETPNLLETLIEATDISNRTYWVCGEIDDSLVTITRAIIQANADDDDERIPIEDRVPIRIMLFTNGGALAPMLSLLDVIDHSKTPVHTYNMGIAESAGFYILAAGHTRHALPRSRAMLHELAGGTSGKYQDLGAWMGNTDALQEDLKTSILGYTDISADDYEEHRGRDWYMSAAEQKKYGVVDEVVTNICDLF